MTSTPLPAPSCVGVVIVAAGSGSRLGRGIPKARVELAGEPVLAHALRGVLESGIAARIAVVVPPGDSVLRALCRRIAAESGSQVATVDGGALRTDSVRAGLAALGAETDVVLIHDAARALTPPEVFRRVVTALHAGARAVIPAMPVVDTVKSVVTVPDSSVTAEFAAEIVTGTPDRSVLRAVQTPQGFDGGVLRDAYQSAGGLDAASAAVVTDDAMLVERAGIAVHVVRGSHESFKITTPLDLLIAEAVLAQQEARRTGQRKVWTV